MYNKVIDLRFVKEYKHVGTRFPFMSSEVVSRCQAMKCGSFALRNKVLKNEGIKESKRMCILQTYILTKGTFQCGTWSDMSPFAKSKFHGCIMSLYRDVLGCYHGNTKSRQVISDSDMLYSKDIMCPETIIKIARLSLFCRICVKAPPILKNIVVDLARINCGWAAEVCLDLRWLCGHEKFSECIDRPFNDWMQYVTDSPKVFRKAVKAYAKTRYANIPNVQAAVYTNTGNGQQLFCGFDGCTYACMTKQQLHLHEFKIHSIKCRWKLYVGNCTHCTVCLKFFGSRERVLNHVRYRSSVCRHNLLVRGNVWTPQDIDAMDLEEAESNASLARAGKRRHAVDAPVVQLCGPLAPILLLSKPSNHHPLGIGHNTRI